MSKVVRRINNETKRTVIRGKKKINNDEDRVSKRGKEQVSRKN
jgi:hypothetical protein